MKDGSLIAWLLEHSGPAIRYRTAAELLDPRPSPQELARVSQELEQSPLVQGWLANVGLSTGDTDLHGSKRTCFENAAGKLTQLGCHRGMAGYDARMAPFRRWLAEQVERPSIGDWSPYYGTLVAAALARGGYRDGAIGQVASRRLEELYGFTKEKSYDLYIPQDTYPGFPKAFRRRPLISPEISGPGGLRIPVIHDILLLAARYDDLSEEERAHANTVIAYILEPAYQRLPNGYGVVKGVGRHYYGHGWDVKLPGFFGYDALGPESATLVQRLELLARFPAARGHPWFGEGLAHLEGFRTPQGAYAFPREYLRESEGYWVSGYVMGLEQDRRSKRALEVESTFWMLRIKRSAAILGQNPCPDPTAVGRAP